MSISTLTSLVVKLRQTHDLDDEELISLIENTPNSVLYRYADEVRREHYGIDVFVRGLIEFSNICKNDCYYCGIRKSNIKVERYCLTQDQILSCCEEGYNLGYRTFVLQSGESFHYNDAEICNIVSSIKKAYQDCAVTLSLGEKSKQSYQDYFNAGADRYLLRHETADPKHYAILHPSSLSFENRIQCLYNLKEIGYQVGSGFMVGSPYQTVFNLVKDLRFLQKLQPDMIGIGTFLSHKDTPFRLFTDGDLMLTLKMISILRLMFPYALIPSTTALGTAHPSGREMGLKAGANVLMPNISPMEFRGQYEIYDHKICIKEQTPSYASYMEERVRQAGYKVVVDRGDVRKT